MEQCSQAMRDERISVRILRTRGSGSGGPRLLYHTHAPSDRGKAGFFAIYEGRPEK